MNSAHSFFHLIILTQAVLDEEEARQKNPESKEEAIEPVDVLANVLQGIKFELGSVSMDRNGSTTLERLVNILL